MMFDVLELASLAEHRLLHIQDIPKHYKAHSLAMSCWTCWTCWQTQWPKAFCRRIVTRWLGKAASTMDSDTVAALADYIFHGWTEGRESAGCVSWTDYCTLISSYVILFLLHTSTRCAKCDQIV